MRAEEDMAPVNNRAARHPAVAFVPYGMKFRKLRDVRLDDLLWPIGRPPGLRGKTVADLVETDHLITYPGFWAFGLGPRGISAQLSIMFAEPRTFHWHFMILAQIFYKRFGFILTSDQALLARAQNALFFPIAGTWIADWRARDTGKTLNLSLIASKKKSLPGHKLRHRIAAWLVKNEVEADLVGTGYKPLVNKADGLAPYHYSVVIENCQERGYFTEKIIDALLLKTVPVYWGAPDIEKFFQVEGMIVCQTERELEEAILSISPEDYSRRRLAIEANYEIAATYADIYERAAKAVLSAGSSG